MTLHPDQRARGRATLNLSGDEAQALAMLLDAAVTNALRDDDAAVLDSIRCKLSPALDERCRRCGGTGVVWDGESYSEDAGDRLHDPCPDCAAPPSLQRPSEEDR